MRSRCVVLAGPPAAWREEWLSRMAMSGLGGSVAEDVEDTVEQVLLLEPRTLVLFENSRTAPPVEVVNRLRSERRISGMEIVVVQREAPEDLPTPQAQARPQPTPAPAPAKAEQAQPKGILGWLRRVFRR